jgi:hypothetical protein
MRCWNEELAPYYEKLISTPDLATKTRELLDDRYSDFLCMVADAMSGCDQYSASKKLLHEGLAHFRDADSDARKSIVIRLIDLAKTEEKLGIVFNPEAWEDAMPSANRTAHLREVVRIVSHSTTDKESRAEGEIQYRATGFARVAGMVGLKEQLIHDVVGPFMNPELYRRYRVSLPNGILFYGPPGCGKNIYSSVSGRRTRLVLPAMSSIGCCQPLYSRHRS